MHKQGTDEPVASAGVEPKQRKRQVQLIHTALFFFPCQFLLNFAGIPLNLLRDRKDDKRGVNKSRLKFFSNRKYGLRSQVCPNPNILGEMRSSYGEATPTQSNFRNKRDKRGSKHAKTTLENARYNSPVDLTYMNLNTSAKTVRQSRQQRKAITG